jgi:hypothetical protein
VIPTGAAVAVGPLSALFAVVVPRRPRVAMAGGSVHSYLGHGFCTVRGRLILLVATP